MGRKRSAAARGLASVGSPTHKRSRTSENQSETTPAPLGARDLGPMVQRLTQVPTSFPQFAPGGQAPFAYHRNMNGSQLVGAPMGTNGPQLAANADIEMDMGMDMGLPYGTTARELTKKRSLSILSVGSSSDSWPTTTPASKKEDPAPAPKNDIPPTGPEARPSQNPFRRPPGVANNHSITPLSLPSNRAAPPAGQAGPSQSTPTQPPGYGQRFPFKLPPPPPSSSPLTTNSDASRSGGSRRRFMVSNSGSPIRGSQQQEEDPFSSPVKPFKKARQVPVKKQKQDIKKQLRGNAAAKIDTKTDNTTEVTPEKKDVGYHLRPRRNVVNYAIPAEIDESSDSMAVDTPVKSAQNQASQPVPTTPVDTVMDAAAPNNPEAAPQTPVRNLAPGYLSSSDEDEDASSQTSFDEDDQVSAFDHLSLQDNNGNVNLAATDPFQAAFDEAIGVPLPASPNPRPGSFGFFEGLPLTLTHDLPGPSSSLETTYGANFSLITDQAEDQVASSPSDPFKTDEDFRQWFTNNIKQMMYVSGESGEPSVETTGIIEDIVRQQVVEILRSCTEMAARRGSRSITINDLIFQIRDDAPKVSRLRTFLSWKDVRKNVKDSDDKGGEADLGAGEDPVGGVVPGGPVDDTAKKNKKAKVGLPWEPSSFYQVEVPEREDEEDEEEEEMNYITLQRLRKADERTKAMTREEYVTWSEYRQASFTYRKGKRFREWAGFGLVTDSKPSDDIVDILGFLTFEMVQTLTEEALKIKEHEDLLKERTGDSAGTKKRKLTQGLFDPPSEGRTPVEPRHIQEAFRRLQQRPKKFRAMLNGTRLQQHTNLRLF